MLRKIAITLTISMLLAYPATSSQTDTSLVRGKDYFGTTMNEINKAKNSINVFMYYTSIYPNQPNSESHQLVDALVDAKKRGVDVQVLLDQNIDFAEGPTAQVEGKSMNAYEYLKANGVPVYFDNTHNYMHSKVVVIDGETVILGSTNWTKTALTRNNETNVLIRSKDLAQEILRDLSQIERQQPAFESIRTISLSWEFLNSENLMGQMVTRGDERAFDVYLWLLKEYEGNPEAKVTIDFDKLAQALGMDDMTEERYRQQSIKVLRKLESDYQLVEAKFEFGGNAEVILKDITDPSKLYNYPETRFIQIPETFWTYGWNKRLSFAAKAMYLLNLSYSPISNNAPSWHVSQDALAERHHISSWFISQGMQDLRQANLLEIQYEELGGITTGLERIAVYTPERLYNPEDLEDQFKTLADLQGQDRVDRARDYAKAAYAENDYGAVTALLNLAREYGDEVVQKAVKKVSDMRTNNPKKSVGYLINTIKGMANDQDVKEDRV